MIETCLVYPYIDSDGGKNKVEIPKAALTKFIKEVCVPLRKTFKERIADNKLDYFSKSYSARNYNGFVFDRYFETDASFVLFVCNRDGDCYVHFSFDDDSNTFYEIPIYWTLKKNKIEFEYYLEEVNVEI